MIRIIDTATNKMKVIVSDTINDMKNFRLSGLQSAITCKAYSFHYYMN